MQAWISPSHLGVLIPILFVCGAIVVVIVAIIIHGRNKDLEHRERLLALEKGIPLPVPKVTEKPQKPIHVVRRAWGIVFTALGLGLIIAISAHPDAGITGGVWGLLPLFIGIGLIVGAMMDKKEAEEKERMKN